MSVRYIPEPALLLLAQLIDKPEHDEGRDTSDKEISKVPSNEVEVSGSQAKSDNDTADKGPSEDEELDAGDGRDEGANFGINAPRVLACDTTLNPCEDGISQAADEKEVDRSNMHGPSCNSDLVENLTGVPDISEHDNFSQDHDDKRQQNDQGDKGSDEDAIFAGLLLLGNRLGAYDELGDAEHENSGASGADEGGENRETLESHFGLRGAVSYAGVPDKITSAGDQSEKKRRLIEQHLSVKHVGRWEGVAHCTYRTASQSAIWNQRKPRRATLPWCLKLPSRKTTTPKAASATKKTVLVANIRPR